MNYFKKVLQCYFIKPCEWINLLFLLFIFNGAWTCVASSTSSRCDSFNVTLVSCCCASRPLKIDRNLEKKYARPSSPHTDLCCLFSLNVLYKAEQNFQNVSFRCYRSSLSDQGQQECTNLVSSFSDGLIKLLIDFHSFSVALFLLPLSHLRLFSNAYMISQFCASVRDKEWFSLFLPEAPVKKTVAHGSRR